MSLLEWLANIHMHFGATLEIMMGKTQVGLQFYSIGGILGYHVDFQSVKFDEDVGNVKIYIRNNALAWDKP